MRTNKEIKKIANVMADNFTKTCECGKRNVFYENKTFICGRCGKRVFLDDKAKFKYELERAMKKGVRKNEK